MTKYMEHLWKSKVLNKASLEEKTRIPCVRALPLPIPMGISRDDEAKLMSMFYSNNLLNSFLHLRQNSLEIDFIVNCIARTISNRAP